MGQAILPLFLFLLIYAGFLLPVPTLILAWREHLKRDQTVQLSNWRAIISVAGLILCSVGVALSVPIYVGSWRGQLEQPIYFSWILDGGTWLALGTIAVSCFAASKMRTYLVLCAIGLFCFFAWTMGEAI